MALTTPEHTATANAKNSATIRATGIAANSGSLRSIDLGLHFILS
jgi:hypothetical protein